MHIGFVINDIATEKDNYTTIRLARVACAAGHRVSLIGIGDFIYDASGAIHAFSTAPARTGHASDADFLDDVQSSDREPERLDTLDLDVLFLRSDPADELVHRPWAPSSALMFTQLAAVRGLLVLNDPTHLMSAQNKTYFQHFPEAVRPAACITRDPEVVKAFLEARDDVGVIKPLQGSGGHGVFIVRPEDKPNLNQMIDAVTRDGYAIVQEYLPKAAQGDLRLLMLNGRPLKVSGHYACFQRFNEGDDARSNISAGGSIRLAVPDDDALRLAELVGPKLRNDGMYFVGLDIVGDKLMEINVDTPGGINMADDLTGESFSSFVLEDLQRKVRLKKHYAGAVGNVVLSMS